MNKLEKAKEIIEKNYRLARAGIFDTPNLVGDEMGTLYNDNGLTVSICMYYEYFEVFGLTDDEFAELKDYYNQLVWEKMTDEERKLLWMYMIFNTNKITKKNEGMD